MVHPHPGAMSTKSSSLYYLGQVVTTQSFSDPYFAQDKISVQFARSFFLALQHKTTTTCTYLVNPLKIMHRALAIYIRSHRSNYLD
jgi:hypothetical protein